MNHANAYDTVESYSGVLLCHWGRWNQALLKSKSRLKTWISVPVSDKIQGFILLYPQK